MKFTHAVALFDAMDLDAKERVTRDFDLTWGSHAFRDWRDAFAAAVEIEADAIEGHMLFEQKTAGRA
jgi:hypothetical protein